MMFGYPPLREIYTSYALQGIWAYKGDMKKKAKQISALVDELVALDEKEQTRQKAEQKRHEDTVLRLNDELNKANRKIAELQRALDAASTATLGTVCAPRNTAPVPPPPMPSPKGSGRRVRQVSY